MVGIGDIITKGLESEKSRTFHLTGRDKILTMVALPVMVKQDNWLEF